MHKLWLLKRLAVYGLMISLVGGRNWAEDKEKVTVTVESSHVTTEQTYHQPANCNWNSGIGSCTEEQNYYRDLVKVAASIDGRSVWLGCSASWRFSKCTGLEPGEYQAELKGNAVWVQTVNVYSGKKSKIKFTVTPRQ